MKDALGARMKANYEDRARTYLNRRTPVIIRLDGCHFHTLTKRYEKPFSRQFQDRMLLTAINLIGKIQGCMLAYTQSDEISLLLIDYHQFNTEAWFDYNQQKIVSVSASMASMYFNNAINDDTLHGYFDARAFNVPREEVHNYFVWRQKDAMRNSLSALAQANFSAKELHGKNRAAMHEMLHTKGINWNDLHDSWKRGIVLTKFGVEYPEFSAQPNIVGQFVYPIDEEGM